MNFRRPGFMLSLCGILVLGSGCGGGGGGGSSTGPIDTSSPDPTLTVSLSASTTFTTENVISPGSGVFLQETTLTNNSSSTLTLANVTAEVRAISAPNTSLNDTILVANQTLASGESLIIPESQIWLTANDVTEQSYLVYLTYGLEEATTNTIVDEADGSLYTTFFRILADASTTTYDISRSSQNDLPAFTLQRGLSAEYAIEKSAASLASGISHSWLLENPPAVHSSPDFLQRSIDKTISFYDDNFGENTPIETVVIGTGIPAVPYVARATKGVVLPVHFLVGAETIKEIQTIVDYANNNGDSAYAAFGHDFSITNSAGVAWIKMLSLPQEYLDFITRHNVQHVVLYGYAGSIDGERAAEQVLNGTDGFDPGAIYLMYIAGDASTGFLRQAIQDFDDFERGSRTSIPDWESGILSSQIDSFTANLKTLQNAPDITYITSERDLPLWDMGTYATLAFMHKNRTAFESQGRIVQGVSMNPYLLAHPGFESSINYVPFLYFAGIPAPTHIPRLNTDIRDSIASYFPEITFDNLNFWVNLANNHGGVSNGNAMVGALSNEGFANLRSNDFSENEIWNPADGLDAPSEVRATELLSNMTATEFKAWNDALVPLSQTDLIDIGNRFNTVRVNVQ